MWCRLGSSQSGAGVYGASFTARLDKRRTPSSLGGVFGVAVEARGKRINPKLGSLHSVCGAGNKFFFHKIGVYEDGA